MDKPTIERIKLLHPALRDEVIRLAQEVYDGGVQFRITQTLRTWKEQEKIYAQGRTAPGKIVSWAPAGKSWHQYGLAFDFCLLKKNKKNGLIEVSWDMIDDDDLDGTIDWYEVVNKFRDNGWTWGGDFPVGKKDYPHLQKTFGLTLAKARELSKEGKVLDFPLS